MRGKRSILLRGTGVLAAIVIAGGAIGPAMSAKLNRPKVKKIAQRQATKVLKANLSTLGGPLFIGETEVDRFYLKMQQGASDQPIGTYGPFTLTAACGDDGGNVQGTILITTSEANSIFWSEGWGHESDFDPSDPEGPVFWIQHGGDVPGGAPDIKGQHNVMHALSPSGRTLEGLGTIASNFGGSHCVFEGAVTTTNPVT